MQYGTLEHTSGYKSKKAKKDAELLSEIEEKIKAIESGKITCKRYTPD